MTAQILNRFVVAESVVVSVFTLVGSRVHVLSDWS
jgi:hypothetical protein